MVKLSMLIKLSLTMLSVSWKSWWKQRSAGSLVEHKPKSYTF